VRHDRTEALCNCEGFVQPKVPLRERVRRQDPVALSAVSSSAVMCQEILPGACVKVPRPAE
jgi:hypothetical protein